MEHHTFCLRKKHEAKILRNCSDCMLVLVLHKGLWSSNTPHHMWCILGITLMLYPLLPLPHLLHTFILETGIFLQDGWADWICSSTAGPRLSNSTCNTGAVLYCLLHYNLSVCSPQNPQCVAEVLSFHLLWTKACSTYSSSFVAYCKSDIFPRVQTLKFTLLTLLGTLTP